MKIIKSKKIKNKDIIIINLISELQKIDENIIMIKKYALEINDFLLLEKIQSMHNYNLQSLSRIKNIKKQLDERKIIKPNLHLVKDKKNEN